MENTTHKFELVGLGKAPFRVVGHERRVHVVLGGPPKPGASCDFCGTAIVDCYFIRGADGREFKVGSDCVAKTDDAGLVRQVNKAKAVARNIATDARIAAARALVAQDAALRARLEAVPGPKFGTMLEHVEWMFAHAGRAGKLKAARRVEEARG